MKGLVCTVVLIAKHVLLLNSRATMVLKRGGRVRFTLNQDASFFISQLSTHSCRSRFLELSLRGFQMDILSQNSCLEGVGSVCW